MVAYTPGCAHTQVRTRDVLYADEQTTIGRVPLPKGCEHPSAERGTARVRVDGESRAAGAFITNSIRGLLMMIVRFGIVLWLLSTRACEHRCGLRDRVRLSRCKSGTGSSTKPWRYSMRRFACQRRTHWFVIIAPRFLSRRNSTGFVITFFPVRG